MRSYNILKFTALAGLALTTTLTACKKSSLQLVNPNQPGESALQSEEGARRFALGIYNKPGLNYWWLALANHDIMGDSYYIPWGNFAWRWVNQVSTITTSTGTVITPPQGGSQQQELQTRNDRSFGDDNAFRHEWLGMYFVNNQANVLLANVDAITFTGNADIKKKALRAWAYWWKGFAYSRIGSMYVAGLINDQPNQFTSDFVSPARMIQEGNANFDKAIAELTGIADNSADYLAIINGIIPDFTKVGRGGNITPSEFIRQINTYKARNILIAKKPADITSAEWTSIVTLCNNGLRQNDKILTARSNNENDFVSITGWAPWRLLNGWFFVSERLVQDFKAGDARFTRNVAPLASTIVNAAGRGFQYGTRFQLRDIGIGGDWASSTTGRAEIPIGTTYEENELMLAEAKIRTNDIPGGVGHINNVRTFQNAGLAALPGTLTLAQALEELRSERRIGLFLKGVSFYDARRWGVIDPVSQGGGRTKAVVVLTGGGIDSATFNYNYMRYWDVPLNELDFNTPSSTSVPVKTN
ncbi:MAG TPA: RagB/SusD family nutrient uptake outer membrane protein [Lacibacter sp.]|nr:RagB/SusD family nutrient uptake outer membrane protein [Lacibacter sp.]HMO88071.1 RagB/SusD family nutrient uptake outer membrane protein [Lacibacter sp.]HMP86498.1 RagB/SusD family nutrient uptake outer membrane protein [Lacibacter sp.]